MIAVCKMSFTYLHNLKLLKNLWKCLSQKVWAPCKMSVSFNYWPCVFFFVLFFSLEIRSVTSVYTSANIKTDYKHVVTNQTISEIFYLILSVQSRLNIEAAACSLHIFIIFTSVLVVLQHTKLKHLLVSSLCEQSKMQKALWVKLFLCMCAALKQAPIYFSIQTVVCIDSVSAVAQRFRKH